MNRPRETRRSVVILSRMRCGAQWRQARILNVSKRGIGLTAAAPPDQGAYVEIRRGAHNMVARVIWVRGLRFGVQTQDLVPIDSLGSEPESSSAPAAAQPGRDPGLERRSVCRSLSYKEDKSRAFARLLEFAFLAILGASAAAICLLMLEQSIQRPLERVQQGLRVPSE